MSVGPARAGMIRLHPPTPPQPRRWPRTSGDDPFVNASILVSPTLAPHERG